MNLTQAVDFVSELLGCMEAIVLYTDLVGINEIWQHSVEPYSLVWSVLRKFVLQELYNYDLANGNLSA